MRLKPEYVAAIKTAAADAFGPDAIVRLFGSRVDDGRRGGDIDLHVETIAERATLDNEVRFRAALWRLLDEPQIDVVVAAQGVSPRWIDRAAMREGRIL